jgi:hypothetical protein
MNDVASECRPISRSATNDGIEVLDIGPSKRLPPRIAADNDTTEITDSLETVTSGELSDHAADPFSDSLLCPRPEPSVFDAITFEATVEEEDLVEDAIDGLLHSLPRDPSHAMSPASPPEPEPEPEPKAEAAPAGSLFDVTAPSQPVIFRWRSVTALDLENVINVEGLEPPDEATERALRSFSRNGCLPESASTVEVVRQLQRQRVNSILEGDYDRAQKCETLAREVPRGQMRKEREERRKARISALEEQLQLARMEYAALHRQSAANLAKCDLDLQRRGLSCRRKRVK